MARSALDVVDLLGTGSYFDASHGAERHQLAARGVDGQSFNILGTEPILLAPQHQVDFLTLELIAIDEGTIQQRVNRRADVSCRKP